LTGRRLSPAAITVLIVLAALVYFASFMRYGLAYDEGYLLDSVERILDGQVIYRDFHHTYAPGSFYLVAALFRMFGQSIMVERWVFVVLEALKCGLAFLIVRTVTRSRLAYLAPVLVALAPGPWHKVFFPAFGFLALYAVLATIERRPRWFLAAGGGIGISAIFRQDVAVFALVGCLLAIGIEEVRRRKGLPSVLAKIAWLGLGLALAVGPVSIWFYRQGALGAMLHKLTVDGVLDNMTNRIPYPGLGAATGVDWRYALYVLPVKLFFYLPFVVYGLSLVLVVRALAARVWTDRHTALSVILVASAMAFNQSTFRSDIGHLLQTMQFVFLLVPPLLASGLVWPSRRLAPAGRGLVALRWGAVVLPMIALVWVTLVLTFATRGPLAARFQREGIGVGDTEYIGSMVVRAGNTTNLELARAPIYVTPGEARFFMEIKGFLDANTSPGEYVLAVPQLQTLYFLFDRRNPTRYAHYRRSLSPAEEARYIDDIKSHGTAYILLTEPFEVARFGETSQSFSEYARPVRDWILANYVLVERIGGVKILRKRQ
jgi:hypothetical protein